MSFLIKNDELLEKCNEIQEKGSNNIKEGFESEHIYNEKHLKTKVKSYQGKTNTNFLYNKRRFSMHLPARNIKTFILKFVYKSADMLLKKRRFLSILLMTQKVLLLILMKKILVKKILMKKVKYRKNYSKMRLVSIFLMSQMFHPYILQKKVLSLK